jgi:drug/metabolite transporter (DMT)-like permease
MFTTSSLWIIFTLFGSVGQTIRNAAQRSLIASIGTIGATQVRFLFGLPFSIVFLGCVYAICGEAFPHIGMLAFIWTFGGALAQILATALMLAAMRDKSFVVTTALIKTEAVQVAIFSLVVLHEQIKPLTLLAILFSTLGVFILSWPKTLERPAPRAIVLGLVAGGFFGLSAIGFREGIRAIHDVSFMLAASTTLVLALFLQCLVLGIYMAARDRGSFGVILSHWRGSMLAGFVGAMASEFWFLAFSLASAASVRTLALIEMLFALGISKLYFRQPTSRREILGMVLVGVGVMMIVQG